MKALFYYLAQVIVTSGVLYTYYHFALRNKIFHRYNRFYLLAATVISITIPFLDIPVYFTQTETESSFVLQTLTVISSTGADRPFIDAASQTEHINWFNWQHLSYYFYILITFIALVRIIFSLIKIKRIANNNPVELLDNINFVNTDEPGTPFSFFRWLFWNRKIELHSEKGEQIFRHELFHIKQKHSWDIMYMELLTVVFWINPFFHLMKKEVKAIHEFLADQFAIAENTKWQYAEILLMQAMNTNQQLVNPFFDNQVKRRIAMITTSKKPSYQYLRKLMVFPIAAIVIALFAFSYKSKEIKGENNSLDNSFLYSDTTPQPNNTVYISGNVIISTGDSVKTITPSKIIINGKEISVNKIVLEGFDAAKIINAELYFSTDVGEKDSTIKGLLVLDGEKLKGSSMEEIVNKVSPVNIELINVLKGTAAVHKYGDDGKNGVIEIITKKKQDFKITEITQRDTVTPQTGDNKIFEKVEIEPSFPGGADKWRQYLMKNLDASVPVQKKAPAGTYTVLIQFIVDKEGKISEIKALTNHGFGMEDEAMRVIRLGPKWAPAIQNGHEVNAYKRQPITFMVGNGQKNFPSAVKTNGNELNEVVVANISSQKTNNKIFDKVETPPSFPGGESAWKKYLERNANGLLPVDSGAPAGVYKVMVQFIVHEDGSVSDVKALTNHGYGMENEAMRVIKKGPKWVPAKQNGHIVRAYVYQPITFAIAEEEGDSNQNSLQPTTTTSPGIPKITVAEIKKASVYKLLQLPEGTEIMSFLFTIDSENGDIIQITDSGSSFNYKIRNLINTARPGRTLTIDEIRIKEDGKEKKMPSKAYLVVD